MSTPFEAILEQLQGVTQHDGYVSARCPAHGDQKNSLLVTDGPDKVSINCLAGCEYRQILEALGITAEDTRAVETVLTPETFARERGLPSFVLAKGWIKAHTQGVEIPFYDLDGTPLRSQLRTSLQAGDGTRYLGDDTGTLGPYGLWQYKSRTPASLWLVEGATDVWAMRECKVDAVGFPGATTARKLMGLWAEWFKQIPELHVVQEPDGGGDAFVKQVQRWCQENGKTCAVHEMAPLGVKDPFDLWKRDGNVDALVGKPKDRLFKHEVYQEVWERFQRILGGEKGMEVGIAGLDEINGGFLPGHILYLNAPPKSGKSTLAGQMADYVASQGHKIVRVELEMTPAEQVARILRMKTHKSLREATASDAEKILSLLQEQDQRNVFWCGNPDLEAIVQYIRLVRPKFVVIDYLQYITTSRNEPEMARLERVSSTLVRLAKEIGFCGVFISSMDKDTGKKIVREKMKPDLFTLKGSAQLAHDAYMVATLLRISDDSPVAELRIIANRGDGGQGQIIRLQHNKHSQMLEEIV